MPNNMSTTKGSQLQIIFLLFLIFTAQQTSAATKTCTGTGSWNTSGTWSPSGVPSSSDDVIITGNFTVSVNITTATCKSLNINSGSTLTIPNNKKLTISGAAGITANGTLDINSGDLTLSTSGATFTIGAAGVVNWLPKTNTLAGATLFTNGTENFSSTSTLKISSWYNYAVPLKNVISGGFGNLTITTLSGGTLYTWQMMNTFHTNPVAGTLTIDNGYVVLDNSNTITTTTIGNIVLNTAFSYLDCYNGTRSTAFTVTTNNLTITGGELDCFYTAGIGTCTFNVTGNLTITAGGLFIGANGNNGTVTLNVSGNATLTKSGIYGVNSGTGNFTLAITGNFTLLKSGATYSEYYGIIDGTGNTTLTVGGNFSHQGYSSFIFNSGVTGMGNGNATCTIGGTFSQSDGNLSGIWNLTTYTAGVCNFTAGNINFTGGVFMVHYGCSAATIINTLTVNGNLSVSYSNSTDIFRGIGLSSLNSTDNGASFVLVVNGNTLFSGNLSGEFTSSAATGNETITTDGSLTVSGGNNRFDYSTGATTWNHGGNISVSAGTLFLSATTGTATINVAGNIILTGGTSSLKGNTGNCTLSVNGNFDQSAGTFFVYNNAASSSTGNIATTINGNFSQAGGILNYSNNTSNTGDLDINLKGANYNLAGTGSIITAGAGTGTLFGKLNFNRAGTMTFARTSSTHNIQQVKQNVKSGCTLQLSLEDLQIASHNTAATDFLKVESGGVLDMGNARIYSNLTNTNSGCRVESGGTLKTANTEGLYNGTNTATVNSAGNMDYYLDANSIVEYNGINNQVVTGIGNGIATGVQHKYGILKINFQGTPDTEYAYPIAGNIFVRTQLNLTAGELNLDNNYITIESGSGNAITRTNGYIKSETNAAVNGSIIKWKNMSSGLHVFPFGKNSTTYIPVSFTLNTGAGNDVEISTRATGNDNTPFTGVSNVTAVTNLDKSGSDVSISNVIDRWWIINAPSVTADIILSYAGTENTISPANLLGSMMAQSWDGLRWGTPFGSGTGVTSGVGTVAALGVNTFSPIVLVSGSGALPIKLLNFDVRVENKIGKLDWSTSEEKDNDYFIIERSKDAKSFSKIGRIEGAGNSNTVQNYSFEDSQPYPGINYYRLKQTDFNGDFSYSPIKSIRLDDKISSEAQIKVNSVGPNPFKSNFSVNYQSATEKQIEFSLYNSSGQKVFHESTNASSGDNKFDYVDENHLPPGNYILNVISGTEKLTIKLIKSEY
ncbi:hypothetical protein BH11BAC2_BH11BAC2_08260 [soil metagenome]